MFTQGNRALERGDFVGNINRLLHARGEKVIFAIKCALWGFGFDCIQHYPRAQLIRP